LRGTLGLERRANLRTIEKARLHTHTQAQGTQPLHRGPPTSILMAFQQTNKGRKVAVGRRPVVVSRRLGILLPPHGVRPSRVLGMGGQKDVSDERPVGRGAGRPQRREPGPDGEWRLPWREREGSLPQERRTLLRHAREPPAGGGDEARRYDGRRGRRCLGRGAGHCNSARRVRRLPPFRAVRVAREPLARRHRRMNEDGWAASKRSRRGRRDGRRRQSLSGGRRGRAQRERGGRSPDGAGGRRRRGRLYLGRR